MGSISIGYSELDGNRKYIAKKIPKREDVDLRKKFLTDLWFIDQLYKTGLSQFEYQFPSVHGLQLDGQGVPQSIITEDYSQRNKEPLLTTDWGELHPSTMEKVAHPKHDLAEVARAGFRVGVNGPVRLGDFDTYADPDVECYRPFLEKLAFSLG